MNRYSHASGADSGIDANLPESAKVRFLTRDRERRIAHDQWHRRHSDKVSSGASGSLCGPDHSGAPFAGCWALVTRIILKSLNG